MVFAAPPDGDIWIWSAVLIGAIALVGVVAWLIRRWWSRLGQAPPEGIWSLQQLRDLRSSGQISEGEYERLRSEMLAGHGALNTRNDGRSEASAGVRMDDRNAIK